ncbi:MAG TPA: M23 family metallopeptidase [Clostridia bacterium]|nr:M23 family metallopeptidase [Clostridia bacterium]
MKRIKNFLFLLLCAVLIVSINLSVTVATDESSLQTNIALNPSGSGYPSPLESDQGWGGGSNKWDIVDGLHDYSDWQTGLAFTGGNYGVPGVRQATIAFGSDYTFNKVVIWHHNDVHIPAQVSLQYWDGSAWQSINSQRDISPLQPNAGYADTLTFEPVTGSKVRYSFDNSQNNIIGTRIEHGWIYEFEVYEESWTWPAPSSHLVNCVFYNQYDVELNRLTSSAFKKHEGIDTPAGGLGSQVVAAKSGKVTFSGWQNGYGNCIEIKHSNDYSSFYAHLADIFVNKGDTVKAGDSIGIVGNTGGNYGYHLHFEVRDGNKKINPLNFYKEIQLTLPSAVQHKALIGIPNEVNGVVEEANISKYSEQHAHGYIRIRDLRDSNLIYEYKNLNDIYVKKHDRVKENQIIADSFTSQ